MTKTDSHFPLATGSANRVDQSPDIFDNSEQKDMQKVVTGQTVFETCVVEKSIVEKSAVEKSFIEKNIVKPAIGATSVTQRIRQRAQQYPHAIAVRTPKLCLSYQELIDEMDKIAISISATQFNPEKPIVIVPGLDMISLIKTVLGILEAGGIYVYLQDSYPPHRLAEIFDDIQPQWIVTNDQQFSRACQLIQSATTAINILNIGVHSNSTARVCHQHRSANDLLAVLFTSGTTGRPKGIKINHQRYLNAADTSLLKPSDRVAILINFNLGGIFLPLMRGACVFPYNPNISQPTELLHWLKQQRVNIIAPPAALFRRLLQVIPKKGYLSDMREVFLHGEAVLPSDIKRFRQLFAKTCRIFTLYSATETFGICRFEIKPRYRLGNNPLPAGYPVKHKQIRIVDQHGKTLPKGELGEIAVVSRFLSPGYWNEPQLTAKYFRQHDDVNFTNTAGPEATLKEGERLFLTGDIGFIGPQGCLHIRGRKDRQAKVRGYRVEPESVEMVLNEMVWVKEATVKVLTTDEGEKRLVAYLVMIPDKPTSIDRIREQASQKLPSYMLPSHWMVLDYLPRLASMKVDYKALPPPLLSRKMLSRPMVPPRNAWEQRLLHHWQQVFNTPGQQQNIGVKDNFFELGGDSLMAITLIDRIEKDLQYSLPPEAAGNLDSIEILAQYLSDSPSPWLASEYGLKPEHNLKPEDDLKPEYNLKPDHDSKSGHYLNPSRTLNPHEYNRLAAALNTCQFGRISKQLLIRASQTDGRNPPLFWCFNSISKEPQALSQSLGSAQPIYALFSGIHAIVPLNHKAVKRIALHYLDEMLTIQPHGPYRMGGNCSGARIMVEIAKLLLKRGESVEKIICMEAFDPMLFQVTHDMLLLYGKESHLQAHKAFNWGKQGWQDKFDRVPDVQWLPGPHGQFFNQQNVPALANYISRFLTGNMGE